MPDIIQQEYGIRLNTLLQKKIQKLSIILFIEVLQVIF